MLPKIEYSVYEFYIKSLDRKVKFRPFLVKEEKILLMAKESKDADAIRLAIKQIIQNCAQEEFDVESLPLFDVEMIFLKLRAKSIGEAVKLVFNCKNEVEEGKPCDTNTDYVLDLEKVKYEIPEGHDPKIMITDTVGIKLKYPTLGTVVNLTEEDNEFTSFVATLLVNIEYIFDENSIYKPEDTTKEEVVEFLTNLKPEHLLRIREFFETAPKVILEDTVTCKKCGFVHTLHAENLLDFFT
jgi:hypothetical protein